MEESAAPLSLGESADLPWEKVYLGVLNVLFQ